MAVTIESHRIKITIATFYRSFQKATLSLMDIKKFLNYGNSTIILTEANIKHRNFGHGSTDNLRKLMSRFKQQFNLYYLGPDI